MKHKHKWIPLDIREEIVEMSFDCKSAEMDYVLYEYCKCGKFRKRKIEEEK